MRKSVLFSLLFALLSSMPKGSAQSPAKGEPTSVDSVKGGKWRIRYFYDQARSSLLIQDFRFLNERHAVGTGFVSDKKNRAITLLSDDAGATWKLDNAPEAGYSLFFLDDSLGWMTSGKSIFRTEEGGRSWKRVSKQDDINQLAFLSPTRGFAVGSDKTAFETNDGGRTWTPLAAVSKISTKPETTNLEWLTLLAPNHLLMMGQSIPVLRRLASGRIFQETPNTLISLESSDGGKTWTEEETSIFGRVGRLRPQDGRVLLLMQYLNRFAYSSELFVMDRRRHDSGSRFRATDVFLTDVDWSPDGYVYLAGVQRTGEAPRPVVPGPVHVYRSRDLASWEEMPVDYKATAQRVILSTQVPGALWLATDTGMVLHWETTPAK